MSSCEDIEALLLELDPLPSVTYAVKRVCAPEDERGVAQEAEKNLVGSERAFFDRVRSLKRRAEFCAGRIAARAALSSRESIPVRIPLEITRDARGVPRLVQPEVGAVCMGPCASVSGLAHNGEGHDAVLHLSISHSHGFAVAVVAPWPVGVDIESIEERPESFWRLFLCEAEQSLLLAHPGCEQSRVVNMLWTRKEAACKVGGWGGAVPFREIDCSSQVTEVEGQRIVLRSSSRSGFAATLAHGTAESGPATNAEVHHG